MRQFRRIHHLGPPVEQFPAFLIGSRFVEREELLEREERFIADGLGHASPSLRNPR